MTRALAILYIVFCFELGLFLFFWPWTTYWSGNYFVDRFPLVSSIARNYFVRGAVSGIGLADVWLAIYELWALRRRLGLVRKDQELGIRS